MMEVVTDPGTMQILCCECGTLIEPNPANMCVGCIRTRVDITDGITKQNNLQWCKGCLRYLNHNNQWISCSLESKELLAVCLKKLKGLNTVRLVDASFIWTEPHSKRIKVKLILQKEVNGGAILQQSLVIEFVVMNLMCNDCHRREAKDFWKAVVQIRQKVEHKKTFYYLEQLMLKHNAASNILNIKPEHGGLDFYFASKDDARKFSDFVQTVVPCRGKSSQRLISHDTHNNTFNYKSTFSLEIPPVCKDSIVCLSRKFASSLGSAMGQLAICTRVTKHIHLINPVTGWRAEISSDTYYANPFSIICPLERLSRFIVIEAELVLGKESLQQEPLPESSNRVNIAECWVTKDTNDSNFGTEQYFCRTHLGHLLRPGDLVLGLHLPSCNINDTNLESMKEGQIPEVILVKKIYFEQSGGKKRPKRKWKLKRLEGPSKVSESNDYKEFLNDLEEDPELRRNINIYRDDRKRQADHHMETTDTAVEVETDQEFGADASVPRITLQEMLEDFHMSSDGAE